MTKNKTNIIKMETNKDSLLETYYIETFPSTSKPLDPIRQTFSSNLNDEDFTVISNLMGSSSLSTGSDSNKTNPGFWEKLNRGIFDLKNKLTFNVFQFNRKFEYWKSNDLTLLNKHYRPSISQSERLRLEKDLSLFAVFTYRNKIDPIVYNTTAFSTDAGWGCMIRCAQMVLFKAFMYLQEDDLDETLINLEDVYSRCLLLFYDNQIGYDKVRSLEEFGVLCRIGASKEEAKVIEREEIKEDMYESFDLIEKSSIGKGSVYGLVGKDKSKDESDVVLKEYVITNGEFKTQFIAKSELQSRNDIEEYQIVLDIPSKLGKHKMRSKRVTPPFSIARICALGLEHNKGAGEWFSNYSVLSILSRLHSKYRPYKGLEVLNFQDSTIRMSSIIEKFFKQVICSCKKDSFENINSYEINDCDFKDLNSYFIVSDDFKALKQYKSNPVCSCLLDTIEYKGNRYRMTKKGVIFLSTRVGYEYIEEEYIDSIKEYFLVDGNIGIIGGKGSRALYFIGLSKGNLIFLDPHFVQEACDLTFKDSFNSKDITTYKIKNLYQIEIESLSASFSFGFCFRTIKEYTKLIERLSSMSKAKNSIVRIVN